jgi:2-phospho-L-lactate/phosphoenolpyruvate guanylyltransferase
MRLSIALVPVKRLEQSKSRMLSHLPNERRQALTLAMLADLLEALSETRGLDRIAVTTPDSVVAALARSAGAEVLMRPEPGLNEALEDGIRRLEPAADEPVMIVLGDVAGALAADFETLLSLALDAGALEAGKAGVWLVPSSDGGTSALLMRPANSIPCRFGRDSAQQHRDAAADLGVAFHEVALASLAIDLDQPEDLEAFLSTRGGGRRTRELLEEMAIGDSK